MSAPVVAVQGLNVNLPGPPVAMHRPKFSRSNRIDGRGVRALKDEKDKNYQLALGMAATNEVMYWAQKHKKRWDGTGEWEVELEFRVPDLRRRDIDNLLKNALDALSGIVYDDDTQVVSVSMVKKLDRKSPGTHITVRKVDYGYLWEVEERAATAGLGLGS